MTGFSLTPCGGRRPAELCVAAAVKDSDGRFETWRGDAAPVGFEQRVVKDGARLRSVRIRVRRQAHPSDRQSRGCPRHGRGYRTRQQPVRQEVAAVPAEINAASREHGQ